MQAILISAAITSNSDLQHPLHINHSIYKYLLPTVLAIAACMINLKSAKAEVNHSEIAAQALDEKLMGDEILQAFANVHDDARVQDAAQTRAVNYWHSDGRFISRWKNSENAGEVTGTWRVKNDMRCVTITKGVPHRIGKESCGVIIRRGDEYLSFNADGSIHGVHSLKPLDN